MASKFGLHCLEKHCNTNLLLIFKTKQNKTKTRNYPQGGKENNIVTTKLNANKSLCDYVITRYIKFDTCSKTEYPPSETLEALPDNLGS